jgi:hypothetical protein
MTDISVDAKLERALAILERLDHAVNGNGRPGLLDRMTVIEINQRTCPARESYGRQAQSNRIAFGALVMSAVSALFAWLSGR